MIEQVPVGQLSFRHPFSDIQKCRRILNRRPGIPRVEPEQTRCCKGRTDTECKIQSFLILREVLCFSLFSGNSKPQKLQDKQSDEHHSEKQIAAV